MQLGKWRVHTARVCADELPFVHGAQTGLMSELACSCFMVCLLSRETNDHALVTATRTDLAVAIGLNLPWLGYERAILTLSGSKQVQHSRATDAPRRDSGRQSHLKK